MLTSSILEFKSLPKQFYKELPVNIIFVFRNGTEMQVMPLQQTPNEIVIGSPMESEPLNRRNLN